ncbi:MAG: glycosyltransferase family 4 protein [Chloroflexota bacterium]
MTRGSSVNTLLNILFIADGRSPIAANWIKYFVHQGHKVHLVSTFPCDPEFPLASMNVLPVGAFGVEKPGTNLGLARRLGFRTRLLRKVTTPGVRMHLRHWLVPLTLPAASRRLKELILDIQPNLVHALRIPYEGMLATLALQALPEMPLLISVWGNDFTLHARSTPLTMHYTRQVMRRATALHTDCRRDVRLAHEWGFAQAKPAVVLPGGGGVQLDIFYPSPGLPKSLTVINPRGMRGYVRNDTFFKSIPLVLGKYPRTRFVCPAMADEPQVQRWVDGLGIRRAVDLLPRQSRTQMADLFCSSQVVASITTHDGIPNTLLEAMACGCFPIVGDILSLREWITHGENGFLVDPGDVKRLAEAICLALGDEALRQRAARHNLQQVAERAEYSKVMSRAERFYEEITG